jgi:hypothetical protein
MTHSTAAVPMEKYFVTFAEPITISGDTVSPTVIIHVPRETTVSQGNPKSTEIHVVFRVLTVILSPQYTNDIQPRFEILPIPFLPLLNLKTSFLILKF